ncbi:MAG: type II/IV secretion system ATPase subunit [Candidatus Nanohaloarchaea archaeon]|nr:type II/IV secretion system ATPase subunit [Candidatus Nanohaloarchaea archaeon]
MARLRGALHDEAIDLYKGLKNVLPLVESEEPEDEAGYGEFQIESTSANLIVIPDTDDVTEIDVRYPLLQPFADAHIHWDDQEEELVYEIEEPTLSDREEQIFERVKEALEKKISVPLSDLETSEDIIDYLQGEVGGVLEELGYHLSESAENKLMYYVYRNFGGLNEIEPLMHDPYIEDIGCSGTGIPIYIIHTKFGSIRTNLKFDDEDNLRNLIVKLAERANKYVSYSDPLLDGTLPDGSRVNASLTQDVTTKGPTFSIRKFQEVPFSAVDLLDLGTVSKEVMAYMWLCLEYQKSALVIGGTATGKTTFLNSVVSFIPPEMKIVSIEDTRELQLPHENWIPSVTRSAAGEEQDDITMYELLRESFRQNPDYVVVGEVRGKEASVLFQGMASGHPSLSTMHASTPADVVSRLTTPPINLSPALVETLDMIVSMTHAREWGENARRVSAVYEIEDISDEGTARTNEYFSWTAVDDSFAQKADSTILDNIQQQYGLDSREVEEEMEDRKRVLDWLHEKGYTHFEKVSSVISEYYKDKDTVMRLVDEETAVGFEDIVEEGGEQMPPQVERERTELEQAVGRAPTAAEGEEPAGPPSGGGAGATGQEQAGGGAQDTPAAPGQGVDYSALVQNPVGAVKERVDREGLDPQRVMQAEKAGRNRESLLRWLRGKVERADMMEDESEEPDSGDEEQEQDRSGNPFDEDAEDVENPFE